MKGKDGIVSVERCEGCTATHSQSVYHTGRENQSREYRHLSDHPVQTGNSPRKAKLTTTSRAPPAEEGLGEAAQREQVGELGGGAQTQITGGQRVQAQKMVPSPAAPDTGRGAACPEPTGVFEGCQ